MKNIINRNAFLNILFLFFLSSFFLFSNTYTNPIEHNNHLFFKECSVAERVLFPLMFILTVFSYYFLLFNRNRFVKTLTEILLFSFVFIDLVYFQITATTFGINEAINMINNFHFAGPAVESFYLEFASAFVFTAVLFFIGYRLSKNISHQFPPALFFLNLGLIGLLYSGISNNTKIMDLLPAPYRIPLCLYFSYNDNNSIHTNRPELTAKPVQQPVQHLFFIVDESISATALSINNSGVNTTPFLKLASSRFINFGQCYAYTNYSAGSNFALLTGAGIYQLPDKNKALLHVNSLFQYAKNAGYTTYYIDAQTKNGNTQNYFKKEEFKYIDHFFQPANIHPEIAFSERDYVIADSIISLANSPQKIFAYINKAGAHWPYKDCYPFTYNKEVADNGGQYAKSVIDYLHAITWSVDIFWKKVVLGLQQNSNTTIVYTADHGENFTGSASKLKHGSLYDTEEAEATVPLFIFNTSKEHNFHFDMFRKNRYHHQNIFPTLLSYMGYSSSVYGSYPPGLFDNTGYNSQFFLTGDLFGRGRNYRVVVNNANNSEGYFTKK